MSEIPVIPENAPFSNEQRLWLNGFLAGYFARMTVPVATEAAPSPAAEPLLIMFGSQTGAAEGLAKRIGRDAAKRGFEPRIFPLNDYERASLTQANKLLIVSSTWGDGDPPDNAADFWSWLKSDAPPRLDALHFAVLGLGDRNYAEFCGAAKKFDARLEALGAHRLVTRAECDVEYEAAAKTWLEGLWVKLSGPAAASSGLRPLVQDQAWNEERGLAFGKANPFPGRLLKNACLNKPGSSREVRHYEIGLNDSGLTLRYEVGDALGIMPVNCPDLVAEIIGVLRATAATSVKVGDTDMPLAEALSRHLDITRPSPEFLAAIALRAPSADLQPRLEPDRVAELKQWLWGRDVIDLLRLSPEPMHAAEFVTLLRKLSPRLYSISSSYKMHPEEAHLTVSTVRYESHGRPRKGVASTFLAERAADSGSVGVFVQSSHGFKLPADGGAPIIMVGPGTGVAPFRAFLEDREAVGARGKNWLFFGGRNRETDFLYEDQLTAWQRSGHLTRLDLAFSRDQTEKVYVQHRMLENAAELWSWLDAGAHFYVCGDASRMAKDVDGALSAVVEKAGGKSPVEAGAYVAKLRSEKRYQRDVY